MAHLDCGNYADVKRMKMLALHLHGTISGLELDGYKKMATGIKYFV